MIRLQLIFLFLILGCCAEAPQEPQAAERTDLSTPIAIQPVHATVSIEGMHCQNCANAISRAMNRCSDVRSVAVSFNQKQATIIARNSAALDCAIHAAQDAGYAVGPPQPVEDEEGINGLTPTNPADAAASTSAT